MTAVQFFEKTFRRVPQTNVFVPGRVNLIGEHIDYNGGRVLPFALNSGVEVALSPLEDDRVVLASDRFEGLVEAALGDEMSEGWARYGFYAARLASRLGWRRGGAEIAITSNLSDGAGVSSSAALCVAVLKAMRALSAVSVDDIEIAQLARRVENQDIGMPCGIMDQMAVAIAEPGEAIFLDTATLDYETIALPSGHLFPVLHSGVRRELSDGRYRERKEECDAAKAHFATEDLCHLDLADVEAATGLTPALRRRVRHCITEHKRAEAAAAALHDGQLEAFGALMDESHTSMRDDFEMSAPGVDELVVEAKRAGALGARLTGGGFGGCIVACVEASDAARWRAEVLRAVPRAFPVS